MKKKEKKLIIQLVALGIIIVLGMSAACIILWQGIKPLLGSKSFVQHIKKEIVKKCDKERLLDGVCIGKDEKEKYPIAIVIDNKYEARPWSGLSFAGLVFEAPVEGGITRFLAFYSSDKEIEKIGPVRSARPYFIDWAMGVKALFFHVGGSPEALNIINNNSTIKKLNLDQYFGGLYYWRSTDRIAPHNVYTSSDMLDSARDKKTNGKIEFDGWKFKDGAFESERGEDESEIKIEFSYSSYYDAVWDYDRNKNIYIRQLKGEPAKNSDDSLILAKNIAVMETDIWIIDSLSRRKITTIGKGDALVFQDGKKIEGMWEKKDIFSQIKFFDKNNNEIKFNRGTTWIEVVYDLDDVTESAS